MSIKASARSNLARWLDRLQPSESVVLGGAALLVGLTSGIGVWLFKRLIDLAHLVVFGELGTFLGKLGIWTVALLPMLGGLVVGLVVHYFIGEERHHGSCGAGGRAIALSPRTGQGRRRCALDWFRRISGAGRPVSPNRVEPRLDVRPVASSF